MLIIKRSNFINTTSGIVFHVSDRPVCRLRRNSFSSASSWSFTQSGTRMNGQQNIKFKGLSAKPYHDRESS